MTGLGWVGALGLAAIAAGPGPARGEDPRAIVAVATRAVEGDSAGRLRARWTARLSRDAGDRSALLGLATLSRLQYDYPAATTAYRRLMSGSLDRHSLYARMGLAEGLEERRYTGIARAEYDTALVLARRLGDRTAQATILLELSFMRGRLEGVKVAEALLDSAAGLIPPDRFDLQAGLRSRRGITLALRGRAAEASIEADSGIALARRARAPKVEADGFRIKGQVLQYRGQWDSALAALHQSEELYLRARSRSTLANSLIWHAQVLGSQGRYGEMRQVMQRALAEGEATHNPAAIADAHRAFGVLAQMFGDWPGAAEHLKAAAATSKESGDSSGVQYARKYQVMVSMVAGDLPAAKRLTLERLAHARQTQAANERFESARNLADILELEGDTAGALSALEEARAQLRLLPGAAYGLWLHHDEARHALARGDFGTAARLLEAFIRGEAGPIGNVPRFDGRVRLAEVYARRGDVTRAGQELDAATRELDEWRAGLSDAELRTMAFQVVATVDAAAADPNAIARSAASVLAALAQSGKPDQSFALAERWRARELMDRLNRSAALRTSKPGNASAGAVTGAPPRSAVEVASALPDSRTALLEFVAVQGAPLTAFVVQRSGVKASVIPLESLADLVGRFNALVESGADARRLARTLGERLLDPILPLLDPAVSRLVIVPDGPLHRLTFDALLLADGRFLVERYAVGLAPSASVAVALWAQRATSPPAGPVRLLALGDPSVSRSRAGDTRDGETDGLPATTRVGDLPPLKGAAREARLAARYAAAADVRLGRNASAAFLKRTDLRPYRVLHFATHTIVNERSVAGTALALAPGQGESGFLGTGDVAALRINADLVVLSACTSAGGRLANGEGVQGLTSAFLQAGTRSIVATAWRIPDREVVPLVEAFYAGLARGESVMDALRAAKLGAMKKGMPPRAWAAFMAIGDPLTRVPLRAPARSWWSAIFGGRR